MDGIGRTLERLPLLEGRPLVSGVLAMLFALSAWVVRWAIDPYAPPGLPFVTFLTATLLASFLFGTVAGVLTALVGGALAWYYFLPGGVGFWLNQGRVVALLFYAGVVTVDLIVIRLMQLANRQLVQERERSARLAERTELLFRELQHRVSNNLQMASAVLTLHGRSVSDPEGARAIADASVKLQTIGRIQRQLYDTSGVPLTLDVMLPELVTDLMEGGGKPGITADVRVEPGILLPPDAAIPVVLILAEAVANAIEHGLAHCDRGVVRIQARRDGSGVELSVADDGCGLPPGFDPLASESMGLQIAQTLSRQLGATFTLLPGEKGTVMRLRLPGC